MAYYFGRNQRRSQRFLPLTNNMTRQRSPRLILFTLAFGVFVAADDLTVVSTMLRQMIFDLEKNSFREGWKEFESSFQEVRPGFYIRLNKQYPNLTPNEQKLCAFLSLNMSTKEISSLTFQSVESIRKARYRLRKKLQIADDQNLVSHLLDL